MSDLMEKMIDKGNTGRDLDLSREQSNKLHYYGQKLNFKGTTSERNRINWIGNDCLNKRFDSELKKAKIKKYIEKDPTKIDYDDSFFINSNPVNPNNEAKKKKEIKLKDVIELLKDKEIINHTRPGEVKKDKLPLPDFIEGIPVSLDKRSYYDLIRLDNQNHQNLLRYCQKLELEFNDVIESWLIDYLDKNLNNDDKKRIKKIDETIIKAHEIIEKEEVKVKKPEWDLEK